jgi:hypothetical protein
MTSPQEQKQHREQGMASLVLSRIESEGVAPLPRAHFILRERVVWGVGVLAVLLGALGCAAIIYTARNAEWELYEATNDNVLTFAFDVMPYTWIVALLAFVMLAYESVRYTKRGYRYSIPVLTLMSVSASVCVGVLFYAVGVGPFVDAKIGAGIPLHRSLAENTLRLWDKPARGVVSGVVTEVGEAGDYFTLRSPSNVLHTIRMDDLDPESRTGVVVGSSIRAFAPLVERIPPPPQQAPSEDMFASYTADETAMTMTAQDAPMEDVSRSMVSNDAVPSAMMTKSAPVGLEEEDTPRPELLRQACALVPQNSSRYERQKARERFKECVKELKDRREE